MLLQLHAKKQIIHINLSNKSKTSFAWALLVQEKKFPKNPALSLFKLDDKCHAKNKKILISGSREKTAEKRTNVQRVFYRSFTL